MNSFYHYSCINQINFRPLPSENCKTLVLLAIEKNQLECLKVLLNSGANPNLYLNDLHVTPLIFATQKKNLEIMKYLISNQAVDVNFQTEESMSPLHEACAVKGGFTEGVKYLLSLESVLNESLNAVESELKGETPLSCAIEAGNIESVRLLIANDACINHMQVCTVLAITSFHLPGYKLWTNKVSHSGC